MEVIGVGAARDVSVTRPEGSRHVFLTLEGLREANVRDKDTRLRITLVASEAVRLWRELGARLTEDEKVAASNQ